MNRTITSTLLLFATAAALVAQPAERRVSKPTPYRPNLKAPRPSMIFTARRAGDALQLRGGAVATGLGGFYDYQSNGASPSYLATYGADVLVTTFMISPDESSIDNANAARRVGYAYSADGGMSWAKTSSIFDLRLGFPALVVDGTSRPFIATHGDLGEGDRSFLFSAPALDGVSDFFPLAELPLTTASGREGGVAWPAFVMTKDGSHAVVFGSYANDETEPESPLQVARVAISDGVTEGRWRDLTDSALSNTSGGRTVAARAASGRIGVAWFKYQLDSSDNTWGIYYAQSDDDGVTWSAPVPVLVGERVVGEYAIDGDDDTLSAGANLDLAFRGDEPQLVVTGNVNELIQFANVMFWSPSTGLRTVAMSHQVPGLGGYGIPLQKRQMNMGSIAYPTIAVGDNDRHVVVAFSAIAQQVDAQGVFTEDAVSAEGFQYYRLWGVGSSDGGRTWGVPFIIQDFAEKGTDSASIEYPSAAEVARVRNGAMELPIAFQARRSPGMYIYTGTGTTVSDPGPLSPTAQYFQRFTVTPTMFRSTASADAGSETDAVVARVYPNSTSSAATLEIALERPSVVDVSIVDALGRTVARPLEQARADAGITRVTVDASGLRAGSYHCVVRHGDGVSTTRLEVVR